MHKLYMKSSICGLEDDLKTIDLHKSDCIYLEPLHYVHCYKVRRVFAYKGSACHIT